MEFKVREGRAIGSDQEVVKVECVPENEESFTYSFQLIDDQLVKWPGNLSYPGSEHQEQIRKSIEEDGYKLVEF